MLTLTYIVLAVAGCGYIVVSALVGQLFDFGDSSGHAADGGADAGHGHGGDYGFDGAGHGKVAATDAAGASFQFPFFSPLALATLFASFGAYGLIALFGLKVSGGTSVAVAAPAAFGTAWLVTFVGWKLVQGSRANTMIRLADLTGVLAEVTVPIPAGNVGEVLALVRGQRYSNAAREASGREVARGATVKIVGMAGTTLVVETLSQSGKETP